MKSCASTRRLRSCRFSSTTSTSMTPRSRAANATRSASKHGKPVIVMEPVKGGNLVKLPDAAKQVFEDLHGGSPASYAIRFAAGFPGILMVLSGMSDIKQMKDNISFMQNFQPLTDAEMEAVHKVQDIFRFMHRIACTACRCCTDGCPQRLPIRELLEQVAAELKKKEEPET